MSGHSKWKTIARKKGETDAARGKVFTKFAREILVAVRSGGSADPNINAKLKDLVAKAKANNVPNDNINRLLAKYAASADGADYTAITYEGYGPAGVAVIVETLTDNRNRTGGEVRHSFDKYGGNMGAIGCVSWQFDRKGVLVIERLDTMNEDDIMMQALDAGAADVQISDDVFEVFTTPENLGAVRDALTSLGYSFLQSDEALIPQNYMSLTNDDDIKNMNKMLDSLEDNDDVQNVFHNWENDED